MAIDFEYAAPNPRAYDLANHFSEWMYNYYSCTPHVPNTEDYPTIAERFRFIRAYVAHGGGTQEENNEMVCVLEKEIKDWRVASHAFWCLWGVIMSEDDSELILQNEDKLNNQVFQEERSMEEVQAASTADFDYMAFADQKMRLFWGELVPGRMHNHYRDDVEGSKYINDSQ